MTYTPNTYAAGDTTYVAKLNEDFSNIANLVNPMKTDVDALKAASGAGSDLDFRLNATNILINGGFDFWQRGISSRPDVWSIENNAVGFSVARTTVQRYLATYSALVNDVGQLTQQLQDSIRLSLEATYSISVAVYAYTSTSNAARIGIYDGTTTTWSTYHTGGGSWEQLSTSFTQGTGAQPSELKVILENGQSSASVYWNAAVAIRGTTYANPLYVALDKTLEELAVMSFYETGVNSVRGVGQVVGADRVLESTVRFISPKRSAPTISFNTTITGYSLSATNITRYGFDLVVTEIGGPSGTDGFDFLNISWSAIA